MKNKDTEELRSALREADQRLALLLQQRYFLVSQIGLLKKQDGEPPEQQAEWQAKRDYLASLIEKDASRVYVLGIFDDIHKRSVDLQKGL